MSFILLDCRVKAFIGCKEGRSCDQTVLFLSEIALQLHGLLMLLRSKSPECIDPLSHSRQVLQIEILVSLSAHEN